MRSVVYWSATVALFAGCEPTSGGKLKPAAGSREPPPLVATIAPRATAAAPAAPRPQSVVAEEPLRRRANTALTERGKYEIDLLTQPASAYFALKDQVVFSVQIPKAVQYYELAKGKKPATHEEFMREIVEKNRIELPPLPTGNRYVYDGKTGDLMVESPRSP